MDCGSNDTDNVCDPVALLQDRMPAGDWNNAEAVTDYLLGLVYPSEGTANLTLDRDECLFLLNSDASGTPGSSPFATLTDPDAYGERVRSLAALILAAPKFHDQ